MKNIRTIPPFFDLFSFKGEIEDNVYGAMLSVMGSCFIDMEDPKILAAFQRSSKLYNLDERQMAARRGEYAKVILGNKRSHSVEKYDFQHGFSDFVSNSQMLQVQDTISESDSVYLEHYILSNFSHKYVQKDYAKYSGGKAPDDRNSATGYDRFIISASDINMAVKLIEAGVISPEYPKGYDQSAFVSEANEVEERLVDIANTLHQFAESFGKEFGVEKRDLQLKNVLS